MLQGLGAVGLGSSFAGLGTARSGAGVSPINNPVSTISQLFESTKYRTYYDFFIDDERDGNRYLSHVSRSENASIRSATTSTPYNSVTSQGPYLPASKRNDE
ncbi:hypothetical protein GCM10007209_33110 [Haloferax sulfurifontis]|uniref:Uncharacterized protein n=1 Tax=Haloferax sulfurifontis TaxID=255616 RepID=A0A830DXB7_9EURY|nr:hypothetical protein GCM10007209_33110 [Haloferax sulfurifontis]